MPFQRNISDSQVMRRKNRGNVRKLDGFQSDLSKKVRALLVEELSDEVIRERLFVLPDEAESLESLLQQGEEIVLAEGIGRTVLRPQEDDWGWELVREGGDGKILARYAFTDEREIMFALEGPEKFRHVTEQDPDSFHLVFLKSEIDALRNKVKEEILETVLSALQTERS